MLRIAVAKGRLFSSFLEILNRAGYPCEIDQNTRKLVIECPALDIRFILAKPSDVPTYVEYGAADLGVVGKDTLAEANKDVAELVDLKYGRCEMVVAVPEASGITHITQLDFNSRVATKYPGIALRYFQQHGIQVEMIPLNGSIELGPIVGLSEAIVDITETGTTLVENGLIPITKIMESTCRLIANRVSHKIKTREINSLATAIEEVV